MVRLLRGGFEWYERARDGRSTQESVVDHKLAARADVHDAETVGIALVETTAQIQ